MQKVLLQAGFAAVVCLGPPSGRRVKVENSQASSDGSFAFASHSCAQVIVEGDIADLKLPLPDPGEEQAIAPIFQQRPGWRVFRLRIPSKPYGGGTGQLASASACC